MSDIDFEKGLCCYYENKEEFERRNLTSEEIASRMFEIGYQIGRSEMLERVKRTFICNTDRLTKYRMA